MKKLLIFVIASLISINTAYAGSRGHYTPHVVPRFVAPHVPHYRPVPVHPVVPRYYNHRPSYNPWPLIGLGIGALIIGSIWYDNYGRQCWNQQVVDEYGNKMYDYNGRPITQVVCR